MVSGRVVFNVGSMCLGIYAVWCTCGGEEMGGMGRYRVNWLDGSFGIFF